ncbi:solute carrier family 2, facilitated glucose transporter member 9-like [Terrapene carolina triunguis]|uniref:solute carrier family 2, facilitated glucose transporter member 9-like n=1 Tax=Terrapene triunguis TaxID=2587831 RepID=UPI000E777424|nr:solute carrier family 2, facilitated glucose transporter member 9-like [Terrapene carolina triunguis]
MSSCLSDLIKYQRLFQMIFVLGIGGSLQVGLQISMITYTSMHVKKFINETWQERYGSPLHHETLMLLWSFTVSIFGIGGLLGSMGSGYLTRKYGKKKCLVCHNLLMLAAAFVMGFSKTAKSFEMILIGRFLCGISAVNASHSGNGTLATWSSLRLSHCILVKTSVNKFNGFICLLPNNFESFSFTALKQLWGEGNHQGAIDDMVKEQATTKKMKPMNVLELLKDRSLRCQLCLLIIISVTIQLSGINAIYFYAFDVFRTAGFTQDRIPYISLGAGTCEFCAAIMCSLIIDKFGRRMLLLWGYGLMALMLMLLTTTLSLQHQFFWMPYCSVALIFLFIVIFATGPAGASFPVMIELFTQSSRSSALVICMSLHWVGLYVIGMIFPYVVKSLGTFCFLIFMGFISISWILIYRFLPETKGKSVMEIKEGFKHLNFRKKFQAMGENPSDKYTSCTKL